MHWTNLERDLPKVDVRPLDYLSIPILGRHITSTAKLPIAFLPPYPQAVLHSIAAVHTPSSCKLQ